jgi:hypothetical protein
VIVGVGEYHAPCDIPSFRPCDAPVVNVKEYKDVFIVLTCTGRL